MNRPRIILFGYTGLAEKVIDLVEELSGETVLVVLPANRKGPEVERVRAQAADRGIPCLFHNRPNPESFERAVRESRPILGISASYSHIIPRSIFSIPEKGFVNLHGSLLPLYRGPHTLNWMIIMGERQGGMTLHQIDDGLDTGEIIDQIPFPILDTDTAQDLRPRMDKAGEELLRLNLPAVLEGRHIRIKQDESKASVFSQRKPQDGLIDFSWSVLRIYNFVRALASPYPGAFYDVGAIRTFLLKYESLGWVCALKHSLHPISTLGLEGANLVPQGGDGFSATLLLKTNGTPLGRFSLTRAAENSEAARLKWDGAPLEEGIYRRALDCLSAFAMEELGLHPLLHDGNRVEP